MNAILPACAVRRVGWCVGLVLAGASPLRADSTISPSHPHAYGANIGWVNARANVTNGAVMGASYCTGFLWSANAGWIALGNGPTNGWRYSNASANDWGVNHDGEGRLTGCAYGANIGWVIFEQTYGQPRLDLRGGGCSGYAWGANVGWIGLSNTQAFVSTDTLAPGPDGDGDGIPDPWEYRMAGSTNILGGGTHDQDGDGVSDPAEYGADTDPLQGTDRLRIVSFIAAGATNRVAWTTRPTRLYRLEATNTLSGAGGTWKDAGGGLLGPPAVSPMTQTVAGVTAASRFYRVQAVVPLSP